MPRHPHILRVFTLLLCNLFTMFAAAQTKAGPDPTTGAWSNPIIRHRADPWVWREGDSYYFTATVPAYDLIELRRADSLAGLDAAPPSVIWRKHASGPASHHIWAPELHRIDGKWYVYFAAGRADAIWAIRIYVLECASADPLAGPWIERGQLDTGLDSFSLDATTFTHRGNRYLIWAQHDPAIGGNTNLYIARMDTPWSITGPKTLISMPEFAWETAGFRVNEGPAVLIRNGRVFLAYSASATDANYCLGMLTADENVDLLKADSWKKSATPVLATSDAARVYGPGHNSFTTLPDGRVVLVYHARDYREIAGDPLNNPDRHTRASLITWNPDGTPFFSLQPNPLREP
jgi:GH43 family beta-xylosidase